MATGDFDFAALKRQSRLTLHSVMAVLASYSDADTPATDVHVRWHNKLVRDGASPNGFDAQIIEGVDRLVFQESELTSLGITISNGGVVVIYGYDNASFKLMAEEPADGPENIYFAVSHQPQVLQPDE